MLQDRHHELPRLLSALVPELGIRQLLVFSQARTTDPRVADPDLRAALATYGIVVEVAERLGDEVTVTAHLLEREIEDDGAVRWQRRESGDDGIWRAMLRHALSSSVPDGDGPGPLGLAYALSRWGMVVEVAARLAGPLRLHPGRGTRRATGPSGPPASCPRTRPRRGPPPAAAAHATLAVDGTSGVAMTTPITWADHESWLTGFLGTLGGERRPAPLLVCFTDGTADIVVDSRRERHGEKVTHSPSSR